MLILLTTCGFGCGMDGAEAEAITRMNWYLLIGLSGGLNQQRTGVIFYEVVILSFMLA